MLGEGDGPGLGPRVSWGFYFNSAAGCMYAEDPACIMGLGQVLCRPHSPLAWPKCRGCAQREMGRWCRRTELYLQGLKVIKHLGWPQQRLPKQARGWVPIKSTKLQNILREVLNFCMQFQGLREASEKFISTRKNISSLCKLDLLHISDLLH